MNRPICSICGESIHPTSPTLYGVTGWEMKRSQGGANQIIHRRWTGKVAHRDCVVQPGQTRLTF